MVTMRAFAPSPSSGLARAGLRSSRSAMQLKMDFSSRVLEKVIASKAAGWMPKFASAIKPAAVSMGDLSIQIWEIVFSSIRSGRLQAGLVPVMVCIAVGAFMAVILSRILSWLATALWRKVYWGTAPWDETRRDKKVLKLPTDSTRVGSLSDSQKNRLRRDKWAETMPRGWSVVVDESGKSLEHEGFFLLHHARTGVSIEVPGGRAGGVLLQPGRDSTIKRIWPDGDAYERFSLHTGTRLIEEAEQGRGRPTSGLALLSEPLGLWRVRETQEGVGSVRLDNQATGEVLCLTALGGVMYVGGGRLGARLADGGGAEVESLPAADIKALLDPRAPGSGARGLDLSELKRQGGGKERPPPKELLCPIGGMLMTDPWIAADGFSYEKSQITEWLSKHKTSPVTGRLLPNTSLIPNKALQHLISVMDN